MTKKRRPISYEDATRVARTLADAWGPVKWLRGIGVVADKTLDDSYAVTVFVAKELRDKPPSEVVDLPRAIEEVPVYLEWRGLATARRARSAAAIRND